MLSIIPDSGPLSRTTIPAARTPARVGAHGEPVPTDLESVLGEGCPGSRGIGEEGPALGRHWWTGSGQPDPSTQGTAAGLGGPVRDQGALRVRPHADLLALTLPAVQTAHCVGLTRLREGTPRTESSPTRLA